MTSNDSCLEHFVTPLILFYISVPSIMSYILNFLFYSVFILKYSQRCHQRRNMMTEGPQVYARRLVTLDIHSKYFQGRIMAMKKELCKQRIVCVLEIQLWFSPLTVKMGFLHNSYDMHRFLRNGIHVERFCFCVCKMPRNSYV